MRSLILSLIIGASYAQEVTTHHLMQAICQIESGCIWISDGKVKGTWREGEAGEVGPWQMLPSVLRELRASPSMAGRCSLYAQRACMEWLNALQGRGLSLAEIAAAYHRGYSGRHKKAAQAYAERAMNLATALAKEQ